MVDWPDTLVREAAERRVVVFLGSGFSKAAVPELPTWGTLLNELAEKLQTKSSKVLVGKLIRQGRLLDAAEIITSGVNAPDLNNMLRARFQLRPPPKEDIYNDLLQIDPKTIITTNYDELIEKNFDLYSGGASSHSIRTQTSNSLLADLRSPVRSIVKLHGCITEIENIVLDRRSFFKAQAENRGFFDIIRSLMTVNTVLFLGYSMSDPDIQLILENMNMSSSSTNPHYALVPKFEHPSLRSACCETYNTTFLEYPKGDHGKFPIALAQLKDQVKQMRIKLGIP